MVTTPVLGLAQPTETEPACEDMLSNCAAVVMEVDQALYKSRKLNLELIEALTEANDEIAKKERDAQVWYKSRVIWGAVGFLLGGVAVGAVK